MKTFKGFDTNKSRVSKAAFWQYITLVDVTFYIRIYTIKVYLQY